MILSIIYSTTGLVHLIFSISAMITGALILFMVKGTEIHKKIGYAYTVSMLGCIITSFMIYRLFSGWGLFHYLSVVSAVSLIGGMIPAIIRKPKVSWIYLHFSFMYWSVVGLYAAFISEVFTRMPNANMTLFSVVLFVFFGLSTFYFRKKKDAWGEQFSSNLV